LEQKYTHYGCDSNIAMAYEIGTLLLLTITQTMLMATSRFFCYRRRLKAGGLHTCALIIFLFLW
jgi:hypothetical protein